MEELTKAFNNMNEPSKSFIMTGVTIEAGKPTSGILEFRIQNGPVNEVGVNGCQVTDILEFAKCLIEVFDEKYPCKENIQSILKIEEALHWQYARTKNRIKRSVEGFNKL